MSEIEFSCPGCNQALMAPVEMAGQTVECPHCNQQMIVPPPSLDEASLDDISFGGDDAPAVSAADIMAQAAAKAEAEAEAETATEPAAEAPADSTPTCDSCGTTMEPEAVLCLHCGYHKILGKKISTELE